MRNLKRSPLVTKCVQTALETRSLDQTLAPNHLFLSGSPAQSLRASVEAAKRSVLFAFHWLSRAAVSISTPVWSRVSRKRLSLVRLVSLLFAFYPHGSHLNSTSCSMTQDWKLQSYSLSYTETFHCVSPLQETVSAVSGPDSEAEAKGQRVAHVQVILVQVSGQSILLVKDLNEVPNRRSSCCCPTTSLPTPPLASHEPVPTSLSMPARSTRSLEHTDAVVLARVKDVGIVRIDAGNCAYWHDWSCAMASLAMAQLFAARFGPFGLFWISFISTALRHPCSVHRDTVYPCKYAEWH